MIVRGWRYLALRAPFQIMTEDNKRRISASITLCRCICRTCIPMNPTILSINSNININETCSSSKNIPRILSADLLISNLACALTSKTTRKQQEELEKIYLATLLQRRRERRGLPKGSHGHGHGHSLPMLHLPPTVRNNLVAMIDEFVGTFLFLLMAFASTQIAHTPVPATNPLRDAASYILVCLTFGLSLTTNMWTFYRVTGGCLTPL
jgi:hypothetical protein